MLNDSCFEAKKLSVFIQAVFRSVLKSPRNWLPQWIYSVPKINSFFSIRQHCHHRRDRPPACILSSLNLMNHQFIMILLCRGAACRLKFREEQNFGRRKISWGAKQYFSHWIIAFLFCHNLHSWLLTGQRFDDLFLLKLFLWWTLCPGTEILTTFFVKTHFLKDPLIENRDL